MRKQTKWAVILGAAAVMTFGACMTSFASNQGFVEEDGNWFFYERNDVVMNEWRRGKDGVWYYLGDDGAMVTDAMIDELFYVDSHGARVLNQWRELESVSSDTDLSWFYFGAAGRVTKASNNSEFTSTTIGGKTYSFNSNGEMQTGWLEITTGNTTRTFYHGEDNDGVRVKSSWAFLTEKDDDDSDESWYYFGSTGNLTVTKANRGSGTRINGRRYFFDDEGKLLSGWIVAGTPSSTDSNGLSVLEDSLPDAGSIGVDNIIAYSDENTGLMQTRWFQAEAATAIGEGDLKWFYANNNFEIQTGLRTNAINGKFYHFSKWGVMSTGVKDLSNGLYSFGSDGAMRTGRQVVTDTFGEEFTAFFRTNGTVSTNSDTRGTGISRSESGTLYEGGLLVKAGEGQRFAYAEAVIKEGEGLVTVLVNETGRIQTNRTSKDAGDVYIRTNNVGQIIGLGTTTAKAQEDANTRNAVYDAADLFGSISTSAGETVRVSEVVWADPTW